MRILIPEKMIHSLLDLHHFLMLLLKAKLSIFA